MWEVVKRKNGKETIVFGPASWASAGAAYESEAAKWNTQDEEGNYLHPEVRISLRKVAA